MDKNIYLKSGYLNVPYILKLPVPFIFCVGGRGTGKTYGALKYVLENNVQFLYMRRTQAQADLINRAEFSPFKSVSADTGVIVTSASVTKYNAAFYRAEMEDDKIVPVGAPIGYTLALSTVSNLRGFDMSDCTLLIYDEFIPERHERSLKNEADALFNSYETINRNRELKGGDPLKVLCLANANDIANPVFESLGVIDKVYAMQKSNQALTVNTDRGYAIVLLDSSPISGRKKNTALYKLTAGSNFASMALNNSYNIQFEKQSVNLLEYAPMVTVDGITLYRHKSNGTIYATYHKSGGTQEMDARLYRKQYAHYIDDMDARGLVTYENLEIREHLTAY